MCNLSCLRLFSNGYSTSRLLSSSRISRVKPKFERLEDRTVPATFHVRSLADSGTYSLRDAVLAANTNPAPDTIRFAQAARDGTITLTSGELAITDDLRIDGPGARRLAVSGNDASRVFRIDVGVTASIDDLTITHGNASLRGGGIRNDGTLTLTHSIVSENRVTGVPGVGTAVDGLGGGIFNTGSLKVSHTQFKGNRAVGGTGIAGTPSSAGLGGAIMSLGSATTPAEVTVSQSSFVDNQALGGPAGAGPFARNGLGGAIMNDAGTFDIDHSRFVNNRAVGGSSASTFGGAGMGGALMNAAAVGYATLNVSHSQFANNWAIGGSGVTGGAGQIGRGGAIGNFVPPFVPPASTVQAVVNVSHSTILGNHAVGGAGVIAGNGQGGGIANENRGILTVSRSWIAFNMAIGGASSTGVGGNGLGGGIYTGPANAFGPTMLTLNRSKVAFNSAQGGSGTTTGSGIGGGLYVGLGSLASADSRTCFFWNDATTSDNDVFGIVI